MFVDEKLKEFIKNILNYDLKNDFIFIKDSKFNYIYVNKSFTNIFKVEEENIIGKNDNFIKFLNISEKINCSYSDKMALKNYFFSSEEIINGNKYLILKINIKISSKNNGILGLIKKSPK